MYKDDGEAIEWDGWNLATCSEAGSDVSNDSKKQCTEFDRMNLIAGDLSMMHVYFKDTYIRKYLKEENFGTADAIGNFFCLRYSVS